MRLSVCPQLGRRPVSRQASHWLSGQAEVDPLIRMVPVDGVAPEYATLEKRKYPYTTEVYAIMRKDTPNGLAARRCRDWLLTPGGQSVV